MVSYRLKNKAALLLVLALLVTLFAGCNESGASSPDLLTVRRKSTGGTISIGDTREEAEKVTGTDTDGGWDFTDDGTFGDYYEDAPGIRVDYLDDVVVRLMIQEVDDWELMNGLHPGMPREDALKLYEDVAEREEGASGGVLISYDENLNPIPLDEFAPYVLTISFTDEDVVKLAFIDYNF